MEVPRNHATNKKNSKTTPRPINIGAGAGSFGTGSILLFGGALVTATIVSALAFKTRRKRRSPSDAGNQSRSPSPETQTVDASNQLEVNTNEDPKDFTLDSQNQSDGITSMKELQIKPIQNLNPKEKQACLEEMDKDGNEKILSSSVCEEKESYVDSGFEGKEFDNGLEKIVVECKEQVALAAQTEPDVRSSEEDGGEERKYSEPNDIENGEPIDLGLDKSLVSIEEITTIEDGVVDASEDQEQLLEKAKDGVDETIPENSDGDLIDRTRIDNEVTMAGGINAACVDFEKMKVVSDHEVAAALGAEERHVNEGRQTFSGGDHHVSAVAGILKLNESLIVAVSEDNSSKPLIIKEEKGEESAQKVEEAKVDQKVEKEEKGKETTQRVNEQVSTDGRAIEEANVDDQKVEREEEREEKSEEIAQKAEEQVITDGRAIEVAEVEDQKAERENQEKETAQKAEEQVSTNDQPIEVAKVDQKVEREEKDKEAAQKIEEQLSADVQAIQVAKVHDQEVEREAKDEETAQEVEEQSSTDAQAIEVAKFDDQKAETEEKGEETAQKVKEQLSTDVQAIVEAQVDDQQVEREENSKETAVEVQVKANAQDEFVKNEEKSKEDEIPLVQLNKEDEEAIDDKKVSSDGTGDVIWPDKSTPEANIHKLKVEQKTDENKRTLSKEQNGSNNQNGILEDKSSRRASRYSPEPWNLKLRTWSVLVSIWCLFHWYSELPFPELSLISSILFILIVLCYQNHNTNLIKQE